MLEPLMSLLGRLGSAKRGLSQWKSSPKNSNIAVQMTSSGLGTIASRFFISMIRLSNQHFVPTHNLPSICLRPLRALSMSQTPNDHAK